MKSEEIESLFLRSLDENLSEAQQEEMIRSMQEQHLVEDLAKYKGIRESLKRNTPATFGPYFAQKVIHRIQNLGVDIDQQIVFFFKKYQLAALGVLIALLALNIIFAGTMDLPSLLGIEEPAVPLDDDLLSFDLYETITNN